MDILQDSFGLINHSEQRTHFVTHDHDRSQPIKTNGKTGGNSPCSYDLILTNPALGHLDLKKLKDNKTIYDGHLFTPLQLSPIVKGAMLLEDVLALIDEVAERETGYILKETLKTHQNSAFKVLVQPKLTPKEEKERQDLIQNPTKVGCVSFNDRYLFRSDTPADAPFIILKDKDIVIRGKIDLDKDEKGKTFLELLKTKTGLFWNFKSILEQIDNFYQSGLPIRQEFMDISMVRSQVRARFYCFYTRTVPVIINLIENTRRLLFDTIIKEHGEELAPSLQKARFLLKNNHENIYKLAEKYKYIEDADYFIQLENRRNAVAHPDPFSSGELFARPYQILHKFWDFICNHSTPEQLAFYFQYNPVSMNTRELDLLENDFHSLRSDEMCLLYARKKNGPQTEPLTDNKKAMASIENDPIFKEDSSPIHNHQLRLDVAHGQPKKIMDANIRENTIVQMQQRILFPKIYS